MENKIYIAVFLIVFLFIMGMLAKRYQELKNNDFATFDTFGWDLVKQESELKIWQSPNLPVTISAGLFSDDSSKQGYDPNDILSIRNFFRTNLRTQDGGIVRVEKVKTKGIETIQSIVKIPTKPSGMAYIGTIYFLLDKSMYIIKIQAREAGTTGIRDTVILSKLIAEGKVSYGENSINGWASDPYDSTYEDGALMNIADAEEYDSEFPNHPLSQVRMIVDKINSSIEFRK